MRVFLSSTVFDLIDVRAEVADLLRSLGVSPVMSDDKLSDFQVKHEVNSIETCLVNVESANEFIIILDRRYGPSLKDAGFPNASATHLEYRHAVKHRKPIHFFVRDRLAAEHAMWKRNKRSRDVKLVWADNFDILEFLDEHARLSASAKSTNWYSTFSSSVDLKSAIARQFEVSLLPQNLANAMQGNKFPIFDASLNIQQNGLELLLHAELLNIGGAPAFNMRLYWEGDKDFLEAKVVPTGKSYDMCYRCKVHGTFKTERVLLVDYESMIGIQAIDRYAVKAQVDPRDLGLSHGVKLLSRRYKRASMISFEIEEVESRA